MDGGGGWLGGAPHTCAHARTCTHAHAHTCTRVKHDNFMQMAAPIGGIPGNSLCCHMRVCMHVHACARVWGHPLTTPHPHPPTPTPIHPLPTPPPPPPTPIHPTPTPQGGGPPESVKIQ